MSDLSSYEGISVYEFLRYVFPGQLIVIFYCQLFLTDPSAYSVTLMLFMGFILSFLIHSVSLYKYVPGSRDLRTVFYKNVSSIFKIDEFYLQIDLNRLAMNQKRYAYYQKYQGLGFFKLDACVILILPILWLDYQILTNYQVYEILDLIKMIGSIVIILLLMYHLRDDGLNDVKRAYNLSLLSLLEYSKTEDFANTIQIINENNSLFIKRKRERLHPPQLFKLKK